MNKLLVCGGLAALSVLCAIFGAGWSGDPWWQSYNLIHYAENLEYADQYVAGLFIGCVLYSPVLFLTYLALDRLAAGRLSRLISRR